MGGADKLELSPRGLRWQPGRNQSTREGWPSLVQSFGLVLLEIAVQLENAISVTGRRDIAGRDSFSPLLKTTGEMKKVTNEIRLFRR